MLATIQKFLSDNGGIISVIMIVNAALAGIAVSLQKLAGSPVADKLSFLGKIAAVAQKIVDFLSANVAHPQAPAQVESKPEQPKA
jgi:hypothetical protein